MAKPIASFDIAGRTIATGGRPFVIAEIGVNHDGSLARAVELVDHAAAAGADAVKLQVFRAERLMHATSAFAEYQKDRCDDATPIDMLRRYELADDEVEYVVERVRRAGLVPLATPFSLGDVELIARLKLDAVKIASPDLVNRPLLSRAMALGVPLIVSTGAATLDEVRDAAKWMKRQRATFALLHCVSSYPTPDADVNLAWLDDLSRAAGVPVGYSDHSTDPLAGALAVARGACVLEKHLTYDRAAAGPDHSASADPAQFADYVRAIRSAHAMVGTGGKRVLPCENDVRTVSRQSLVAARDLAAGEPISADDLIVQRPGTGIPAIEVDRVVGRRPPHAIPAGTMLRWAMLEGEALAAAA